MIAGIEAASTKILEFALERPVAALAILAALIGGIVGWLVGARGMHRRPAPVRAAKSVGPSLSMARSGASLLPVAVDLLGNPVVRYALRRAISHAMARPFGR
jgi:hypothetical protein